VHEYIFAAFVGLNKSISLGRVEPLYGTCRHFLTPFLQPRDASLGLSGTDSQAKAAAGVEVSDSFSICDHQKVTDDDGLGRLIPSYLPPQRGADDAKAAIRAAVRYLLRGCRRSDRVIAGWLNGG
jgi:hypothetical protein